ncbi:MAG: DJ-1/PfpI family protein [Saprospiraceae bacterium]
MLLNYFPACLALGAMLLIGCQADEVKSPVPPPIPSATKLAKTFACPPCNAACDTLVFSKAGDCPHCGMALVPQTQAKTVAIFLYDGVEILDFSGPAQVFASARNEQGRFKVITFAVGKMPITSQGFLKIQPDYSLADCPQPDIIVFPGGNARQDLDHAAVTAWLKNQAPQAEVVMSVCTGAFFLADAGLLDDKKATTFHNAIESLRQRAPKTTVLENVRWVDNGQILTTAGVSAGIDGALHLVGRMLGADEAADVARYMEYDNWKPGQGLIVELKN